MRSTKRRRAGPARPIRNEEQIPRRAVDGDLYVNALLLEAEPLKLLRLKVYPQNVALSRGPEIDSLALFQVQDPQIPQSGCDVVPSRRRRGCQRLLRGAACPWRQKQERYGDTNGDGGRSPKLLAQPLREVPKTSSYLHQAVAIRGSGETEHERPFYLNVGLPAM